MPVPPEPRPDWVDAYSRAVAFAAHRHAGQTRKGTSIPYLVHPLRVCERLRARPTPAVDDPVTLLAAVLHDVLEDTPTTYDEVAQAFGLQVAEVVGELTQEVGLPRPERKARMIERMRTASLRARTVKLADRLDNLAEPPAGWTRERWLQYLDESERLLDALTTAGTAPHAGGTAGRHPADRGADVAGLAAAVADLAHRLRQRIADCRRAAAGLRHQDVPPD